MEDVPRSSFTKETDAWVVHMSTRRTTTVGLLLLTDANLFQVIGTYAADWNETHIYNAHWRPHAKFHNAQTMAMAAVLAVASLYFVWRKRGDASTNLLAAAILRAVYWVIQGLANFYPGFAWTDPEFLKPGQTLNEIAPQMILDPSWGSFSLGWYFARKPVGQHPERESEDRDNGCEDMQNLPVSSKGDLKIAENYQMQGDTI